MRNKCKAAKRKVILILLLMIPTAITSIGQKGITLDEAMTVAENNSPGMKRTKLSLIRSEENLNAQNAALKSNFSLSVSPIGYNQSR
jgi:outer membrane protein